MILVRTRSTKKKKIKNFGIERFLKQMIVEQKFFTDSSLFYSIFSKQKYVPTVQYACAQQTCSKEETGRCF